MVTFWAKPSAILLKKSYNSFTGGGGGGGGIFGIFGTVLIGGGGFGLSLDIILAPYGKLNLKADSVFS